MAEPLNATFFAFRKREKGGVLMSASIGFALGLIILCAVFAGLLWNVLGPVVSWYGQFMASGGDPASVEQLPPPTGILWLFPAQIFFLFFLFVLLAAYEAACHRWMIRGESGGGFFGLNLGADTWRVYATYWVWFGLFLALYFICIFLVIGTVVSLMQSGADLGGGGLITFGIMLAALLAIIYFAVRLAPAAATSIGRRKFSFFSAWSVTSDRFWALFGAFLLLIVTNFVVSTILSMLLFGVLFAGAFSGPDWSMAVSDPTAFNAAYFSAMGQMFANPTSIAIVGVYYVVATAIGLMFYTLFYGINSRAVQAALEEGKITPEPGN